MSEIKKGAKMKTLAEIIGVIIISIVIIAIPVLTTLSWVYNWDYFLINYMLTVICAGEFASLCVYIQSILDEK